MTSQHSWDSPEVKSAWRQGAQLQERVQDILRTRGPSHPDFGPELNALAALHGDAVYAELFFHLSRLNLEPAEARTHWTKILELREHMKTRLEQFVDFRTALVQYFSHLDQRLQNPIIIDLAVLERMEAAMLKDELTQLRNYRALQSQLDHELRRAEQGGFTVSLAMLDLDNFKFYNDRNGHEAGNRILVQLARLLEQNIAHTDAALRYGGEEFVLLFPATTKEAAYKTVQRVFNAIRDTSFPHGEAQPLGRMTVSVGIATFPGDARDGGQLVERADAALYAAKTKGRDQIHLYGSNRRSHSRLGVSMEGQLAVASVAAGGPFHTKDLSESGMLIETNIEVSLGTLLDIKLDLADGAPPMICAARAMRVTPSPTGSAGAYQVGLHFLHPDSESHRRLARFIRVRSESLGPQS